MRFVLSLIWLILFGGLALAQQAPSPEQLLRNINAALAQENARLGQENEILKQRLMDATTKQADEQKKLPGREVSPQK